MLVVLSPVAGLLFAPSSQQLILGLPWWVWLVVLLVIIILLYLLFRPEKPEPTTYVEEKVEQKVEPIEEIEKPTAPVVETVKASTPFIEEVPSLDDLTIIEGIGPKISTILREAGLDSFTKLATTSPEAITHAVKAGGIQLFDASTWPEQASLITQARWDELAALQRRLTAGRRE